LELNRNQAIDLINDYENNTFFQLFWDKIGRFLGKGDNVSIWISTAIILCANFIIGNVISISLNESFFTSSDAMLENLMWVFATYIALPFLLRIDRKLFRFLRTHLIDSLKNQEDINMLVNWANFWRGRKIFQLFFSVCISLCISLSGFYSNFPSEKFSFGQVFIYFVNYFFVGGLGVYCLFTIIAFVIKLIKINLKLFLDDPASSPILINLSRELGFVMLIFAIECAVLMVLLRSLNFLNLQNLIPIVILVWIPILLVFFLGNFAFSKQISQAKIERMESLQKEIMRLSSTENLDKDTTDLIISLKDYHDRVKNSRNTLINVRSILNLFSSLALPLITGVLGEIELLKQILDKTS